MQIFRSILDQVGKVVVGKDNVLEQVLTVLLARGHLLLEDLPGTGKTTMALAFSKTLSLSCHRMQFTPDVLPSDITGFSIPDRETGELCYQPGAVLCNLFLADELNRATSRTQSALLEAMEEGQVTVDSVSHPLPRPFFVIATQNPAGASGTQPLPDSQMDRFMMRLSLGYPDTRAEVAMLRRRQQKNPLDELTPLLTGQQLTTLQDAVDRVYLSEELLHYIVSLTAATRRDTQLRQGASPRASLSLMQAARAAALIRDRDYVVPGDVRQCFLYTIAHRVFLTAGAEAEGISTRKVLEQILNRVPEPKV